LTLVHQAAGCVPCPCPLQSCRSLSSACRRVSPCQNSVSREANSAIAVLNRQPVIAPVGTAPVGSWCVDLPVRATGPFLTMSVTSKPFLAPDAASARPTPTGDMESSPLPEPQAVPSPGRLFRCGGPASGLSLIIHHSCSHCISISAKRAVRVSAIHSSRHTSHCSPRASYNL